MAKNDHKSKRLQLTKKEKSHVAHIDIDNGTAEGRTRVKPISRVIQGKKKLNYPTLIAGFPGAGLVGSISTSYIINKLHMNQIACVESEFIVPGVIYSEGKLRHPFRLYSNQEGDVCVLVCEAPIIIQGMHSVLDTVMKWALHNNVREVMVLDGIAIEGLPDPKRTPIVLSSDGRQADDSSLIDDSNNNKNDNNNKNSLADKAATEEEEEEGGQGAQNTGGSVYSTTAFIGGIAGGILSSCLSNGIASKALIIPAPRGIPDPEGAAVLIETLGKTTDKESLKIDTLQLRRQGASLKKRMEKMIQSFVEQQQQRQPSAEVQQGQNPRAEDVMYG
ncbi:MAG: proteasome assembly chaperone family protein [Nitrososphaeraceae archaeon]|nr:proteasome assembly chaperone family protein [Nitrososphaeraceae archaeon]MBV9667120.1 proteasome assembly chaperone family protein [Nitrososphaeraceae archaeon]